MQEKESVKLVTHGTTTTLDKTQMTRLDPEFSLQICIQFCGGI